MEGNKRRVAPLAMGAIIPILIGVCFFVFSKKAKAEIVPRIVINEIQISGASSNDEFIELFNPTDAAIDLGGYKLAKKTKSAAESALVSTMAFTGTIQSHGYFLIAYPTLKDSVLADLAYSSSSYYVSNDSTILLYDENGQLLDKVGFGAVADFETSPAPNPASNQSLTRINFRDTDDNYADFSLTEPPTPQNSSIIEADDDDGNTNDPPPGDDTDTEGDTSDDGDPADPPGDDEDDTQDVPETCVVSSTDIKINEIFPYPGTGDEFVEIANVGEDCVDVSGWKVMDKASHKKAFPENSIIYPGEYLALPGNLYLNNDFDTVYLLDTNGSSASDALDQGSYDKLKKDFSYSLKDGEFFWTSFPTPGEENIFDSPEEETVADENYSYSEKIRLSEIYPNPKDTSNSEYIEIENWGDASLDLFGWSIRDASKSGKYAFKDRVSIKPGKYLAIYKFQSKIALNNSNESVYLHNPRNEVVSSISFEKSQKGASYNFDSEKNEWRWSKYLTPGKTNKFDSEPVVKIKKPKNVYKNLFTDFSASAKDKETKKLKYTWDFSDGRKSYLPETRHKYLATGKYTVTLTVRDDSQTVEKSFRINVKKYPRPDLEIVKILPNPAGKDAEGETIDIKNSSKKKVDLKNWKVATGPINGKLYNHPVSEEFVVNPGETKTLIRELSKFSLNNKAGKVTLVMPDGKTVDEVEYSKDKIADDEVYLKLNDEWVWITPNEPNDDDTTEKSDDTTDSEEEMAGDGEILGATDSISAYYKAGFSSEDAYIFFSRLNFLKSAREMHYSPMFSPSYDIVYLLSLLI